MSLTIVVIAAMTRLVIVEVQSVEPSRLQNRILASAKREIASVPTGSTVILDRVCSYHGPSVIFETWWDMGPALSLALGRKIFANVIIERTTITPLGVVTFIYGEQKLYPYCDRLHLNNPSSHFLTPLRNPTAAQVCLSARRVLSPKASLSDLQLKMPSPLSPTRLKPTTNYARSNEG